MSDNKEIDRWRRGLEEAERELESKTKEFDELQSFFCENFSSLTRRFDHNNALQAEVKSLDSLARQGDDVNAIKDAVETLIRKSSDIALRESDDKSKPEMAGRNITADDKHGAELLAFLNALENSSISTETEHFFELKKKVEEISSPTDLNQVIEQVVTFWSRSSEKTADVDPSQFCALLISEILYQLLEKISLPKDLSERLGELKKQLQKGVTMSKWAGMLNEVSDMASYVQLKINHERLDIEAFLKQVTGRLMELDDYIQGSQKHREKSQRNSKALGEAVKLEMQNLVSSASTELDIDSLKRQIQTGLAAIEKHVDGFKKSETEHLSTADAEVQKLLVRLNELEQESNNLKARVQQERMQAQMDTLTGIANRLGYENRLAQEYARWKRFANPLSLVVWDIDHFKRINDDYGHAAGDKALKTIATLLAGKVRETDYLARYGGEEFVLIMPGANAESARLVAEKLRETVESSGFHFKGAPVSITISAGIAEFSEGDSPSGVFERADKSLYEAKEGGRNRVVVARN